MKYMHVPMVVIDIIPVWRIEAHHESGGQVFLFDVLLAPDIFPSLTLIFVMNSVSGLHYLLALPFKRRKE